MLGILPPPALKTQSRNIDAHGGVCSITLVIIRFFRTIVTTLLSNLLSNLSSEHSSHSSLQSCAQYAFYLGLRCTLFLPSHTTLCSISQSSYSPPSHPSIYPYAPVNHPGRHRILHFIFCLQGFPRVSFCCGSGHPLDVRIKFWMTRSGPSSHRRLHRHNSSTRSQCSDSISHSANSTAPILHRPIPGLNVLPRDGLLPFPTTVQHGALATARPLGVQLSDNLQAEDQHSLITIPNHLIQASHKKLFGNKVVLAFESEYDSRSTLNWLAAFNQESPISLTLSDVLSNSLFVVQFDAALGPETRDILLQRSPLKALDCFAAVNPYGPEFDPSKIPDFKHLTTIHIRRGSPLIFEYLSFVVSPIGRLIRSNLAPGSEYHKITAVVETSLKSFPPLVRIQIPPSGINSIPFDFSSKNARCLTCLSYSHSKSHCTSTPLPSLLGTPLPPPPPLCRPPSHHSQHPASVPSSTISENLLDLQARVEKDKLEIQYWQSLALSLQRKANIPKKPSSIKLSTIQRKRLPISRSQAVEPSPLPPSAPPLPASSLPANFGSRAPVTDPVSLASTSCNIIPSVTIAPQL